MNVFLYAISFLCIAIGCGTILYTNESRNFVKRLFNDIDRSVTDLTTKMNSLIHLLDDQRAAGIEEQTLVALQTDMKQLELATLSIKEPLAMIKAKHASLVQMQPLGPMSGAPDPMMASQQQQSPMNMPTDMSGGMTGGM